MWNKILQNIRTIVVIVGVIILLLYLNQCSSTKNLKKEIKRQEQVYKQNMAALNDTIQVYKNKAGQTSYSKPIADMSPDDIKKYFPELYERLKSELGEVKVIWKTVIEYRDTGSVKNAVIKIDKDKYSLNYDYISEDGSLRIKSNNTFYAWPVLINSETNEYSVETKSGVSTISDMSLSMGFSTGIKEEGGLYKIFITPDNKNVVVTEIQGADVSNLINPTTPSSDKKRFSVGPYVGFGVCFKDNAYYIGPGVGVSLQYSLIRF